MAVFGYESSYWEYPIGLDEADKSATTIGSSNRGSDRMSEEKASILVMKAAGDVRRAAELDKKRSIELTSVADYLESMIFEDEMQYDPIDDDAEAPTKSPSQVSEIEKLVTPFKVRLTR